MIRCCTRTTVPVSKVVLLLHGTVRLPAHGCLGDVRFSPRNDGSGTRRVLTEQHITDRGSQPDAAGSNLNSQLWSLGHMHLMQTLTNHLAETIIA